MQMRLPVAPTDGSGRLGGRLHERGVCRPAAGARRRRRQGHDEHGAAARPGTRGLDRPTVQLDQVAGDREPESEAAELAPERTIRLTERLEDVARELVVE